MKLNGKCWKKAAIQSVITKKRLLIIAALLGACSLVLAEDTTDTHPPGVVIDHLPKSSKKYIGSPSIAVLPNGDYVASCGWTSNITRIFRSSDRGLHWEHLATIEESRWGGLFVHRGALYLMGTTGMFSKAAICKSTDGGRTWTVPLDSESGLLTSEDGYHTAPVPVLEHNDRLWRGMEYTERIDPMPDGRTGEQGRRWWSFVLSAPVDADLLKAGNWTSSNKVEGKMEWLDGQFDGWLEGNAVRTPLGQIVNIIRITYPPKGVLWTSDYSGEKAAILKLSPDGKRLTFDPDTNFIDFPGGNKKFTIHFDPVSKLYWTLSNWIPEKHQSNNVVRISLRRNTLALVSSSDLRNWTVRSVVLYHPDVRYHGFQYADWLIDGNDIIFVSRTAFDDEEGGAVRQHDANYFTFHRISDFRDRTTADPPLGFDGEFPHPSHASLVSGSPIKVNGGGGDGPLAAPAISSHPVGYAFISGGERPDLFVAGKSGGNALYLYKYVRTSSQGVPVFGNRVKVTCPFVDQGTIFQTADKAIHGLWHKGGTLVHTIYDESTRTFTNSGTAPFSGLPRNPSTVGALPNPDGSVEVLLGVRDGVAYRTSPFGIWDPEYRPYTGAGIWHGGLPYMSMYTATLSSLVTGTLSTASQISISAREVIAGYNSITVVNLGAGHSRDLITGSRFGNLLYYKNTAAGGVNLEPKRFTTHEDGIAMRHPTIGAWVIAYPNAQSGLSDLIVGGEGSLYYYRFSGSFTSNGNPIYLSPAPVLEEDADLYGGSLSVPNTVDWDGDGVLDIVAGNSEGRVLFFHNAGTNAVPKLQNGVSIQAGGRDIHIQPGYRMDIQGPFEARWGYTCPTVVDWNEDGLLDILMSDSTACHRVFLNRGTTTHPALEPDQPLYLDGLDMHGTWRVKPGIAKLGETMAYVALDDDDEFHLYWKLDNFNLSDGGKLRLEDNSTIRANYNSSGGSGRMKFNLVDWDGDAKSDLIVGTHWRASVPNPKTGIPHETASGAVLFLKNVGSQTAPVFKFPVMLKFRGENLQLGGHSLGPAVTSLGEIPGPNLIVGNQTGRLTYFKHTDLTP